MPKTDPTREDHVDALRAQWVSELPDLDTEPMALFGRIYRLSHLIRPSIEATFASFGLERGEFDVLASLRRSGSPHRLTPTQLYGALLISSGTLTHRLGKLETSGLVRRIPSTEDGRSSAVELTARGRRVAEAAIRADMDNERALLAGLSARERNDLATLLKELTLAVERQLAKAKPA